MDIESDGSERWEDFFGSSTDIGPSVLGYLDSLANNFNEEAKQLVQSSSIIKAACLLPSPPGGPPPTTKPIAHVPAIPRPGDGASPHSDNLSQTNRDTNAAAAANKKVPASPSRGLLMPTEQPRAIALTDDAAAVEHNAPKGSTRKRSDKFVHLVSPNVLRMVSNTVDDGGTPTTPNSCADTATDQFRRGTVQSASFNSAGTCRKAKQPSALGGSHKKAFPLSKNICKFSSHASHDEPVDEPLVLSTGGTTNRSTFRPKLLRTRALAVEGMDPSKGCSSTQQQGGKDDMMVAPVPAGELPEEDLQNVSDLQRKIRLLTVDLERSESNERDWTTTTTVKAEEEVNCASQTSLAMSQATYGFNEDASSSNNASLILRAGDTVGDGTEDAFVKNCIDSSEYRKTVVEAINMCPNIARLAHHDQVESAKQLPVDGKGKLVVGAKGECKPTSIPPSPKLLGERRPCSDNAAHSTSTSTPSLNSECSSKVSLAPPSTPVLNSRPLSVSSICSYSSSTSSSGSENHLGMGGKSAPPSYQASVESLADPSEPEQAHHLGIGAGNSEGGSVGLGAVAIGMTMCERAVREIIDSESSYVKDLGQVIRGYLEDWKERACLKPDQLNVLFSNIQQIYDFNFKLLNRLRDAKGDPVRISDCFIDLHVEFSCYTKYCTSYPEAISLLTSLLQATHTNALLVSTQKLLKHTLPLGSYLLKPVQRILKYHLLLENLRKHCSDQQVALAHELMKKVAQNIDQMKKKLDQQRFVKELAGILDGWLGPDLSVLGDLLYEGHLTEHGKPRTVLLFQTMLIIAKPKEDKRLQFRAYIPCKNLMLIEHLPGELASFNVIPFDDPKGVVKLTARNRDEKRHWTQQIKQAMLHHFSDIPQRAMELVLQLGDEDERFTDKPYWKRAVNSSPVPEYLERRQQFRRSEMRMRSKKNLMKKDAITPTFRSYSSDLESATPEPPVAVEQSSPTSPDGSPAKCKCETRKGSRPMEEECKCDSVKRQLQEEIKSRSTDTAAVGSRKPARSRSEAREEEQERLKKSLYERRKLSVPVKKQSGKCKEEDLQEGIRTYSSTMIPKRITEMRKRRPKTLTGSSTFYTELDTPSSEVSSIEAHSTSEAQPAAVVSTVQPKESSESGSKTIKKSQSLPNTDEVRQRTNEKETEPNERTSTTQLKDSDIISKLILDGEQFNKILNKSLAKKKSFDSSTCTRPIINPPEPPSTEPPCEDDDRAERECGRPGEGEAPFTANGVEDVEEDVVDDDEPIYESLLRNVHVPYKYAPSSLARHSLPGGERARSNSMQHPPPPPPAAPPLAPANPPPKRTRPESDYVTLTYSELGLFEGIETAQQQESSNGNGMLRFGSPEKSPVHTKTPQLLRNSDTNISYHREISGTALDTPSGVREETVGNGMANGSCSPAGSNESATPRHDESSSFFYDCSTKQAIILERQGSLNMKTTNAGQKSILQRFFSQHSSQAAGIGSRTLGSSDSNLLHGGTDAHSLHRKLSEPNGGGSAGHIYKLGSMDLGSRIAHLDYADPKTLFPHPVTSTTTAAYSTSSSMVSMASNGGGGRRSGNVLVNQESMKSREFEQRDSVLASSSSSDSVCEEQKSSTTTSLRMDDTALLLLHDENCFYERTVEECLEQDFRDSAVYSGDDNDRRGAAVSADDQQHLYETLASVTRAQNQTQTGPSSPTQRNSGPPPPIPAKPAHLGRVKRPANNGLSGALKPASSSTSSTSSRGWVLQQVKRFQ